MRQKNQLSSLDKHLCFSIYACSRAILRLYRPYLDELNLTYPQYLVLVVLWEHEESTIKHLGELLDLDSGTLTPMLKRMESAELLKRTRAKEDERIVRIHITDKGKALQTKAMCIPDSLIQSTQMTDEEMMTLNTTIKKLMEQVNTN